MLKIHKTQQYHIFKNSANRKIVERHVQNIISEYEKNPHTFQSSPIVVSNDLTVIDGQHRLEAAKRLKQPIYYIQDEKITAQDQILEEIKKRNVNQLQWKLKDYVDFYSSQGNQEYAFIKKILAQFPCVSLSSLFMIIDTGNGHAEKNKAFKDGNICIYNQPQIEEFCADFYQAISEKNFTTKEKQIILCREYVKGLYHLYFNPIARISFDIFFKRMPQKANELRHPRNHQQATENIHHICRTNVQR